jgi:hypothetical protein
VLHLLIGELRAKRKELTGLMIPSLEAARENGWSHLVTGEESWFFPLSGPRRMWALAKDEVATKSRINVQSQNSCLQSCGMHMGSMTSISSGLVPKSTRHVISSTFFNRSTMPSFRTGEVRVESN